MMDRSITHELLFARCENWNTPACPHLKNAIMGLSLINKKHLFLLSDKTVSQLKALCRQCLAFKKKRSHGCMP
jgi:hypothetical protein